MSRLELTYHNLTLTALYHVITLDIAEGGICPVGARSEVISPYFSEVVSSGNCAFGVVLAVVPETGSGLAPRLTFVSQPNGRSLHAKKRTF